MVKGRVHSFENMGTVDGPGIRFVVFMQGCPLRCLYCHNPDTWDLGEGTEYTTQEIYSRLIKFLPYIQSSGGGITVTGGEPLLQEEFVTNLFTLCKEKGIHTALDTSGFSPSLSRDDITNLNQLLDHTDLVLLDIKGLTPEKHKKITGLDESPAFKFANLCMLKKVKIWLRYVLVPQLTDSPTDLKKLGVYAKRLHGLERVEILPFHKLGLHKWQTLGKEFSLEGTPEATEKDVDKAYRISGLDKFR